MEMENKPSPLEELAKIENILTAHDQYRQNCLNLIASENYASPRVRSYLTSDFGNRYGCYETMDLDNREYTGNRYINQLEKYTQELVLEVFGGSYADLRPVSGHMAGMAVVTGLLPPGGLMLEVSWEDWGHGLGAAMQCNPHFSRTFDLGYIPFLPDKTIDLEGLERMVRKQPPGLLVLGASGMIWKDPVQEVKQILAGTDTLLAYDVSHVSGLIACGVYPNPLDLGADLIFGSTHKSFPGPQGGFVLTKSRAHMAKVSDALSPCMVTSHHLHRLPALAAALCEVKLHGREYGRQVVAASQALGAAMAELGFHVYGKEGVYSQTHQVLVDTEPFGAAYEASLALERADILCSGFSVPLYDLRIGTQEMVRRGLGPADCGELAWLLKRALLDREQPQSLLSDVHQFAQRFQGLKFALPETTL